MPYYYVSSVRRITGGNVAAYIQKIRLAKDMNIISPA